MYVARLYVPFLLLIIVLASGAPTHAQPAHAGGGSPSNAYLNQPPPGKTPEVFAPGVVSTEAMEFAGVFSPTYDQYVFTRRPTDAGSDNRLWHMRFENGRWAEPQPLTIVADISAYEPCFSPDGSRLYYSTDLPKPPGNSSQGRLWMSNRTGNDWSKPAYVDNAINDTRPMYVSVVANGSVYFTGLLDGKYGLCMSRFENGSYGAAELLTIPMDSSLHGAHPYIAPDERYIVFDAQPPGLTPRPHLYVSFRNPDSSWSQARKLEHGVNSDAKEMCPSVSPDGKYLFFASNRSGNWDIYWVDAVVISDLKVQK